MTWVPPLVPLPNDLYRWSFSRVLDGTEGDGDQEVNVTGEDEAGNTYSYTEEINTLNLDFTNPTASCFVNNNYAKAGDDVNAVIIMSEPEQSGYYFSMITGGLDFNYNASLSNPDLANPRFVYSFTVAEDQPYKSWSGRFYAKDVAGNPASGSYLCNVSGKVDGTSITLSNTDAYAMYYDSDDHTWVNTGAHAKSSSRAYATFRVNSAPASGTMHVYIGSTEMTNYTIPSKYTYLYWYNLDSLGSHGDVLPITVEMEDAAGNITFETLGSLTLDYVVPDTSGTPYFERCDAYTDARLDQNSIWIMEDGYDCSYSYIPTSCGLTGDKFTGEVKIAFGIAEPIDLDELVITVDDYSLTVDRCLSSTTYVVALFSPAGSEPQGAGYSVLAHLEDQAGNQDDVTLGTFWFDFIAPSTPKVDTLDRIRYTRAPWGNSTTSGTKRFLVYGTTGAVENDSRILVYDGEDVADASLIGETESGGTGAFGGSLGSGNEFYLNAADRAEVFITTVDTAGNWSDDDNGSAGIQATKVRDVIWYATPGQKVGGSYLENPHTFEATDWFQPQLYQNDVDELGADAGIDLSGGSSFTSTGTDLSWAIRTRSSSFDPSARFGPAMAYDSSRGRVVLFGGDADIYPYNDTWEWTGSRWVQILPSDPEDDGNPTGRVNAAMAFDSKRGRIVMFGGLYVTDNNETWEYDGTSWELITPTDPEGDGSPAADSDVAMAYDSGRGVTVLFTTDGALLNPSPQTWEYDGTSWDLITLSDPEGDGNPACRTSTAMTYDPGANEMVLFGGSPCASSTPLGDTWLYDGTSWDKVTPASNPDARKASKMVYDADEDRVVLFGGRKKSGISWVRLNDTWEWSGSNWALQTPTDPEGDGSPSTRYSHGMAYDTAREETIIFGGQTTDWVKETWAWNGASWVKRGPINPTGYDLPGVKMQTAATFMQDTNETVILGGGAVENSASDETWIFNNVGWDYQYPVSDPEGDDDPAARGRSTLTYNDDLNAAFLFGGYSPKGFYSDGWWWTGSSWAKITFGDPNGDGSPGARASHAMTYDTDRNVFVLYGGDDPNSPQHMNDTWEMSRYAVYWPIYMIIHEWTLKSPAFVPGPRRDQTMVYDTKRDVTVMSFGRSLTLSPTSYEWNGTNWTLVQPTDPEDDGNPEPRFGHCMAYDTDWQRSIVFGGEGYAVYGDCWEFDGTSWRQLLTSDPEGDGDPAGRKYASLVYDEKYQHLLLIGGNNGGDETWAGIRSTDDRPGHVFSTYFSAAGHDTMPDIKRVTVRWRAAGKSWYSMSSGYYNGARLHLWDEGKWNSVDTNSTSLSSASQLDWTTTNAEILNRIFFDSDRQTLVFGVTPKYYSYRNRSQVKTDSVEVEVQYRLDE